MKKYALKMKNENFTKTYNTNNQNENSLFGITEKLARHFEIN